MVSDKDLEIIIPDDLKKSFEIFMKGQTIDANGVYPYDVRRFLNAQVRGCAYGLKYLERIEKEMK